MAILKDAAASLGNFMLQFAGPGALNGGHGSYGNRLLWLDDVRGEYEAGAVDEENSIVAIAYEFIARKFIEAAVTVQVGSAKGEWAESPVHPLALLLANPNPLMGRVQLMASTALDLARGNAYWILGRSATDKVVQIYWMPKSYIAPYVDPNDTSGAMLAYRSEINGIERFYPMRDVIHFRGLVSDPGNIYLGRDPLGPQYLHIGVDNEIATYTDTVMRNCGVVGALAVAKNPDDVMSDASAADFKRRFDGLTKGQNRAGSVVLDAAYDITFPGVTPDDMALDEIGDTAEERIPAALSLNAMALQLGAGLKRSTYSNYGEAVRSAFDNGIAPLHAIIADNITRRLAPEFGADPSRLRVFFDYSMIPSLQEDRNALHTRVREDFKAGGITRATFKEALGYPVDAGDETVYAQVGPDMSAFAAAAGSTKAMGRPELKALPANSPLLRYDAEAVGDALDRAEPETRALMLSKVEGQDE